MKFTSQNHISCFLSESQLPLSRYYNANHLQASHELSTASAIVEQTFCRYSLSFRSEHSIGVTISFQRLRFSRENAIEAAGSAKDHCSLQVLRLHEHDLHILLTFEETPGSVR